MLLSMTCAYGPEDDDGRGGSHRTSGDSNRHGFDGHSRHNAGGQPRLLGEGGHGQRGFQAGHGHGYQQNHGQAHGHNDGNGKFFKIIRMNSEILKNCLIYVSRDIEFENYDSSN